MASILSWVGRWFDSWLFSRPADRLIQKLVLLQRRIDELEAVKLHLYEQVEEFRLRLVASMCIAEGSRSLESYRHSDGNNDSCVSRCPTAKAVQMLRDRASNYEQILAYVPIGSLLAADRVITDSLAVSPSFMAMAADLSIHEISKCLEALHALRPFLNDLVELRERGVVYRVSGSC